MNKFLKSALIGASGLLLAAEAFANICPPGSAANNCAPPTGYILDLAGQAVPDQYTRYTTSFVATDTTTNLSFAFREDPAFLFLDDVRVTTGGGSNIVVNGGFESGPNGASAPSGWTYLNEFGAAAGGRVNSGTAHSGSFSYSDGAVQAYDGITQALATVIGETYDVEFWLTDNGPLTTFRQVADNGGGGTSGNGIDLLVYAGGIPTLQRVPEPGSIALVGLALVGIGAVRRRKSA